MVVAEWACWRLPCIAIWPDFPGESSLSAGAFKLDHDATATYCLPVKFLPPPFSLPLLFPLPSPTLYRAGNPTDDSAQAAEDDNPLRQRQLHVERNECKRQSNAAHETGKNGIQQSSPLHSSSPRNSFSRLGCLPARHHTTVWQLTGRQSLLLHCKVRRNILQLKYYIT